MSTTQLCREMEIVAVRIGIGGPVGSGKTRLIEVLVPLMLEKGMKVAVVTNDLVTTEDADRLRGRNLLPPELVVGVETGACPHTAIREDPSVNLRVVEDFEASVPGLDVVIVESGGDNLASTFSSDLVDHWIFVIDVAGGDDIPRKRGLGVLHADLLIVNKVDLAEHVGADLERMRSDVKDVRPQRPSLFLSLKDEARAAEAVLEHLNRAVLFGAEG